MHRCMMCMVKREVILAWGRKGEGTELGGIFFGHDGDFVRSLEISSRTWLAVPTADAS